jgi:hypothetical protein
MELRDFAEQVLFATTLDEKLQSPAVVTDERPGSPLLTPQAPGRPAELRFKPQGSGKAVFPSVHRLEREHERGRLLHFFANHELLATELMALALLRFPDAPAAFRRGVWQTLITGSWPRKPTVWRATAQFGCGNRRCWRRSGSGWPMFCRVAGNWSSNPDWSASWISPSNWRWGRVA